MDDQESAATIESILCAIDFEAHDEAVVGLAGRTAARLGAPLCVLHVVEWLESWWSPMKLSGDFLDKLREEGRERLQEIVDRVDGPRPDAVDLEIGFGRPWEVVLETAEARGSSLVVLGTSTRSGASRRLLGTTAERVLVNAPGPVLLVPPRDEPAIDPPRRILLPTDLSLDFEGALDIALGLCGDAADEIEITLLHAVDLPRRYEVHVDSWTDFVQGAVDTVLEHVEEGAADLARRGLAAIAQVEVGAPAEVILEVSRDRDIDLIALATYGGVSDPNRPSGATASRIVRDAVCPVLTVPPDADLEVTES